MSESVDDSDGEGQTPWLFPGEFRAPQARQALAQADDANLQLELSLQVPVQHEESRDEMATDVPHLESPATGAGSPPHSAGAPQPDLPGHRGARWSGPAQRLPPETSLALAPPGAAWAPNRDPPRGGGRGGGRPVGGQIPHRVGSQDRFLNLNLPGPASSRLVSQGTGSSESEDRGTPDFGARGGGEDMGLQPRGGSREAPYPWALDRPCKIHTMEWMMREGITRIWGDVRCKKCGVQTRQEVPLQEGYNDIRDALEQRDWQGRAPKFLLKPKLLDCPVCQRPGHSSPNRYDDPFFNNWLFMVLTQTLGICTLQELRYFCQKNNLHSSGSKAVVLDKAFESIVAQLEGQAPEGE